ncbi:MAG: DedA family protein [Haloplanus sp.]
MTITADGLQHAVLTLVSTYGLIAVFVYMTLETSLLLHFVPSEVVVPFAAALLVTDPVSFVAFVLVATVGATAGSVLAYYLFGRNGARVLDRYGRYVHVSAADLDRWEQWFGRWGETSVFWGRLLPVARALVSVPAGTAGMDLRRFVAFSTAGALLFNVALTALVYTGERSGSLVATAGRALAPLLLGGDAPPEVLVAVLLVVAVAAVGWRRRAPLPVRPTTRRTALRVLRGGGLTAGVVLAGSAVAAPGAAFGLVTRLWDDSAVLTRLGLSPAEALLALGLLAVAVALLGAELGRRVPVAGEPGRADGE